MTRFGKAFYTSLVACCLCACLFGCKNKEPDSITVQTDANPTAAGGGGQEFKGMNAAKPMASAKPVDGGGVTFDSKTGGH